MHPTPGYRLPAALVVTFIIAFQLCFPAVADENPHIYFEQARQAMSVAQQGKAEWLFHRVLHLDPGHSEARYRLADLYFSQKRYHESLQLVESGLSLNPGDAELWVRKGLILRDSGTRAEAQAAYDKAESLAPDNPVILRRASGYYRHIGDLGKSQALNLRRKQLETIKGPGRENPGDKKSANKNKPNANNGNGSNE